MKIVNKINQRWHQRQTNKKAKKVINELREIVNKKRKEYTTKERLLFEDVLYMNDDLLDFLIIAKSKDLNEYLQNVDAFLSFEGIAYKHPIELKYKIGEMRKIITLVLMYQGMNTDQNGMKNG